ncbi:hypothetical protein [Acetanaerobacterium elongatum]|uniref:Uncharacterized protein n=1 Tax=Acetanaerobacterium elongatum TaxID=258515 RepID=A0A1G9U6Z1_9FIRM|nr:hypothetical protein [Acetanaerobacterium elongatum]SDM55603.1 hypothetical protein SAMN05192585_10196 [Acetanaerobacterium elongatum]
MEFIQGTRSEEDIAFVGVGEYITAYIADESGVIHTPEEIDDYLWAYYKYLIADGESLNDLALLDKVLDRCKTGEVSLIIVNNAHPEVIKALRPKFSYALPIDGEDALEKIRSLKEILLHIQTDARMLELDDAELRQLFDGERTISRHSLAYSEWPSGEAVKEDIKRLTGKHAAGTLVCIFVPEEATGENNIHTLYELVEQLLGALPDATHRAVLWNVYCHTGLNEGEVRVEIIRVRQKTGTMETLRAQNELLN